MKGAAGERYALEIISLVKQFRRHTVRRAGYTTLKSSVLGWFSSRAAAPAAVTQVLRDVTLRIPRGASVGIIGRNGSGKSTLLKLIAGIYKPDSGTIRAHGRVAALIELGAGFHPDFTGRENLYLAGIMYGLSREEIDRRFETIVRFAELQEVIDDPVRTYSSGMYMRLGFSLAVHTDPDILMIDEVLAVGDAAFVNKCKEKLAELRRAGKTLLLVTHDLDAVGRWCDEVLWLHAGVVRERGNPRRVIDAYLQFLESQEEGELIEQGKADAALNSQSESAASGEEPPAAGDTAKQRWGGREIEITSVRLCDTNGGERLLFHADDALVIQIEYRCNQLEQDVVFGIGVNRSDGVVVHGSNTEIEAVKVPALGESGVVRYRFDRLSLLDGNYSLDVAVHRSDGYPYDYHQHAVKFVVRWPLKQLGVFVPAHSWEFLPQIVRERVEHSS